MQNMTAKDIRDARYGEIFIIKASPKILKTDH